MPVITRLHLATTMDCNPTSVVDLYSIAQVTTTHFVGNYASLAPGVSNVFLFRDPLRAVVYLRTKVARFAYTASFCNGSGISQTKVLTAAATTLSGPFYAELKPVYLTQASGASPHGSALCCGNNKEYMGYIWMDPTTSVVITPSVANASEIADSIRVYWVGADQEDVLVSTISVPLTSPLATSFTCTGLVVSPLVDPVGGYYRFAYQNANPGVGDKAATLVLQGTAAAGTDVMCHVTPTNTIAHLPKLS